MKNIIDIIQYHINTIDSQLHDLYNDTNILDNDQLQKSLIPTEEGMKIRDI